VKQISAEQAREAMTSGGDTVYIDVRTAGEFAKGHPPNAINIPVVFPNPATRQMEPNPDFLGVVSDHVPTGKRVIVGCQMGGRSQMAAEIMSEAGYSDVSNMQGGFGGVRNPAGGIVTPGWLQMEYPVETDVTATNAYESLRGAR
jgi:rhodanese-related sulfurtransferase